jgi:hypothetical protein
VAQEPDASSPHSPQLATGRYSGTVKSSPHTPDPISLKFILIPSFHLCLDLPSGLFQRFLKFPGQKWHIVPTTPLNIIAKLIHKTINMVVVVNIN